MDHADIPADLKPFFDVCFILFWGICDRCGREQPYESSHPEFSDERWLDEARAMQAAGWTVPSPLKALCPQCSKSKGS